MCFHAEQRKQRLRLPGRGVGMGYTLACLHTAGRSTDPRRRRASTFSTSGVSPAARSLEPLLPAPRAARWMLAASAALIFAAGMMVYLFDRPAGSAWLLPAHWQAASGASWFGPAGAWLPSFAHGFAFSLLTALVLPPQPRFAAAACIGWAVIDTLAELGQHRAVSGWLASAIESALGGAPWAVQIGRYLSRGSFDPADVMAGLAGCAVAWLALHAVARRHQRSSPKGVGRTVS